MQGEDIRSLPKIEKRIVDYLTDRLYSDMSAADISKDLGIDITVVEKALLSLEQKKVVSEYSKKYCIARLYEL